MVLGIAFVRCHAFEEVYAMSGALVSAFAQYVELRMPHLRHRFPYLTFFIACLMLMFLSSCSKPSAEMEAPEGVEETEESSAIDEVLEDGEADSDDEADEVPKAEGDAASNSPALEPKEETAEETAFRERFMDPELVQTIRARSGLIRTPPPEVEHLLLRADLRSVLRYSGPLQNLPLMGKEISSSYNSMRYAMGQDLGCSLQRWNFPTRNVLDLRFDQYRATMVDPEEEARTDAATAYSTFANVRSILMKHSPSRTMVQLSCTESLLSHHQLRTLSERVISRL